MSVDRVEGGFAAQPFMRHLGARLDAVEPGRVTISCDFAEHLTQQHGFVHGAVIAALADTAAGFAALSVAALDDDVLTADLTVHLLRPATAPRIEARGEVVRRGRRITVCRAEVTAGAVCAVATASLAVIPSDR